METVISLHMKLGNPCGLFLNEYQTMLQIKALQDRIMHPQTKLTGPYICGHHT